MLVGDWITDVEWHLAALAAAVPLNDNAQTAKTSVWGEAVEEVILTVRHSVRRSTEGTFPASRTDHSSCRIPSYHSGTANTNRLLLGVQNWNLEAVLIAHMI
jgi:hypothetical protein